ncbi:MAG: hypothetical protein V1645_01560 [archaeon]
MNHNLARKIRGVFYLFNNKIVCKISIAVTVMGIFTELFFDDLLQLFVSNQPKLAFWVLLVILVAIVNVMRLLISELVHDLKRDLSLNKDFQLVEKRIYTREDVIRPLEDYYDNPDDFRPSKWEKQGMFLLALGFVAFMLIFAYALFVSLGGKLP